MASKKPWEGKLFDNAKRRANRARQEDRTALFFTILMVAFAVIVTLIIGFSIYLSVGGSETGEATDVFFNPGVDAVSSEAPVDENIEETPAITTTSSSTEWNGNTLSVQAGEGAGQIASRAGITIERLYELNPEFLETGAWYANPGDIVRVD